MASLKSKISIFALFFTALFFAQKQTIVADLQTKQPISYVTIFTKNGDEIKGELSDSLGRFNTDNIASANDLLNFRHIEYNDFSAPKNNIKDSVFLQPNYKVTAIEEIVINPDNQRKLIENLLAEVVKNKPLNYSKFGQFAKYDYSSRTFGDQSGYAFGSVGFLYLKDQKNIFVSPEKSVIKYKDDTAGTDFTNLQRMLYEDDFIENFTEKFIKSYEFHNLGSNENFTKLSFKSKKYGDGDKGFFVIDNATKAIINYWRTIGMNYILKERTSAVVRNFAASVGKKYTNLAMQNFVSFKKAGKYYQPEEITVKYLSELKDKKIHQFHSTEAQMKLDYLPNSVQKTWLKLPVLQYFMIQTKKIKEEYNALQNIKAERKRL